jgi:hypothetical protein
MGQEISLRGEQGGLLIEILSYENPSTANEDDASWLTSILSAKVGPFSGRFNVAFTTHDLTSLRDKLKEALASLSGTVTFRSTEDDLSFTIEFDKRGAAKISGVIQPHGFQGTSALQFRLDTDQSSLKETLCQLGAVLHQFPVKKMQ